MFLYPRSKIGCGRSKPEQSKYLSFARRGISAKMSGKDGSGSKQQSPKAKASEVGAPNSVVPMGEAKGVVSSVDPISGGVLITTEAGEHLDIKVHYGTEQAYLLVLITNYLSIDIAAGNTSRHDKSFERIECIYALQPQ
jgi:hypothetical protein